MKRLITTGVLLAALAAGCGSDDDDGSAASTTAAPAGPSTTAPPAAAGSTVPPPKVSADEQPGLGGEGPIGTTFTIGGRGGEQLRVTLKEVLDPAPLGPNDVAPTSSGKRLIGLVFTVENIGTAPAVDSPSNSAVVALAGGGGATKFSVSGGPCAQPSPLLTVAPAATAEVCTVFILSADDAPAEVAYGLSTGQGIGVARWKLG